MNNFKNEDLRINYGHVVYELQKMKFFKELLHENITNRAIKIYNIKKKWFVRKKKTLVKNETWKLRELMKSYNQSNQILKEMYIEIKQIENDIEYLKQETIKSEKTINERLYLHANDLYEQSKILSDQILENIQEMKNINTALILCDLIHFSQNSQYEATKIYGIHQTILTEQERSRDVSQLFRDLKSMLTLINKRIELRASINRKTSDVITEKMTIENLNKMIEKLCSHYQVLEEESDILKEKRIELIRSYCD